MEVNNTTAPQTVSQLSGQQLGQDFQTFLNLLTTQLQNQDPLEPMDSNEFTSQLVQFSQVEQQIRGNSLLENLMALQSLNLTSLALSFVGMRVESIGDQLDFNGEEPIGFAYTLPESSTGTTISITDADGNVIRRFEGSKDPGLHEVKWDGLDDNGQMAAAGTYTVKVSAFGETGQSLNIQTTVPGYVRGIESADNGDTLLLIGDRKVPISGARKVEKPV